MDRPGGTVFVILNRGRRRAGHSTSVRYTAMSDRPDVTDLHFAAQRGELQEIERLVAGGIDVNVRDQSGNTPLKYACAEPSLEAIQRLIDLGADVNLADDRGFTPLHCAAGHGFYPDALKIVELLLSRGADINARSIELGFVPLHEATGPAIIRLLLERGADACIKSNDGLTPLEYMIEEGNEEDAKALRTGGAV